jgi:hypothetical protein
MSNHLAVATVTAALKQTVQDALDADVPGAKAQVGRPEGNVDHDAAPVVNVFLYQATPNANGRNAFLPSHDGGGRRRGPSVAALDLHYILSFYGSASGYAPELLLGCVVRALESKPLITAATIQKAVEQSNGVLSKSDLHRSLESIRATPITLSLDEMSKLWSVLFQIPYVLSVAYRLSPLFIESTQSGSAGPPVTKVGLGAVMLGGPLIESVESTGGPAVPIVWGGAVFIRGRGLDRAGLAFRFNGQAAALDPAKVSASSVEIVLAALTFAGAELRAGSVLVEAVVAPPPGGPAHLARVADRSAFVLRSTLSAPANALAVDAGAPDPVAGTITIDFAPSVAKGQEVRLLLDERVAAGPKSLQLTPNELADNQFPAASLVFPFTKAKAAAYHLQAVVDGAASAPQIDLDPASPTFRQITGPTVVIP